MQINAMRNKSEFFTIWQNIRIVFKQIIIGQSLLNVEWCHFALICTLLKVKSLRMRFCLFVLGFYVPVNNEVLSSRSVNSGTVPGQV